MADRTNVSFSRSFLEDDVDPFIEDSDGLLTGRPHAFKLGFFLLRRCDDLEMLISDLANATIEDDIRRHIKGMNREERVALLEGFRGIVLGD